MLIFPPTNNGDRGQRYQTLGRPTGEVAKHFADAGLICVASLISPYRRDRDTCRAMMLDTNFIEVFMNMPLELCEARDPKGLYKLARARKIKGKVYDMGGQFLAASSAPVFFRLAKEEMN